MSTRPKGIPVELSQGGDDWHIWREGGIGASEAAIITGAMPEMFDTIFALYKRKVGEAAPKKFNSAMQRGNDLEEAARQAYIIRTGNNVEARCYIHAEYDWMRASLDGIGHDGRIVEIKNPVSEYVIKKYSSGVLPDYNFCQVQHQLAVAGEDVCDFWAYLPDSTGILFNVFRDDSYINEMITREERFWDCVINRRRIFGGQFGIPIPVDSSKYIIVPERKATQQGGLFD